VAALVSKYATVVDHYQSNPFTVVKMELRVNDGMTMLASAISRLGGGDKWNAERGFRIAKGRAINDLARQIVNHERHQWRYYNSFVPFTDYDFQPREAKPEAVEVQQ